MLVLYMRPSCRYCLRVLEAANELGLVFELRNIANPLHAAALRERGGKQQVPYLVDEERGVEMYESEDIARYLAMTFAA
ncbi:MAG TPA: glutathione S-transferase N-terminal domain-containing protein [Candidatus Paceibacterota bacterium]|nr:glutathione S-transferase N-terminal domain-containing protein [Candidatus Paceibacterota bacterium]